MWCVASTSQLKLAAARRARAALGGDGAEVRGYAAASGVAEQPVGMDWGVRGAQNRLESAKANAPAQASLEGTWISIENFVDEDADGWFDQAVVLFQPPAPAGAVVAFSDRVYFPADFAEQARREGKVSTSGWSVTCGQCIARAMQGVSHDDWHATFSPKSRLELLDETIERAWLEATE